MPFIHFALRTCSTTREAQTKWRSLSQRELEPSPSLLCLQGNPGVLFFLIIYTNAQKMESKCDFLWLTRHHTHYTFIGTDTWKSYTQQKLIFYGHLLQCCIQLALFWYGNLPVNYFSTPFPEFLFCLVILFYIPCLFH